MKTSEDTVYGTIRTTWSIQQFDSAVVLTSFFHSGV